MVWKKRTRNISEPSGTLDDMEGKTVMSRLSGKVPNPKKKLAQPTEEEKPYKEGGWEILILRGKGNTITWILSVLAGLIIPFAGFIGMVQQGIAILLMILSFIAIIFINTVLRSRLFYERLPIEPFLILIGKGRVAKIVEDVKIEEFETEEGNVTTLHKLDDNKLISFPTPFGTIRGWILYIKEATPYPHDKILFEAKRVSDLVRNAVINNRKIDKLGKNDIMMIVLILIALAAIYFIVLPIIFPQPSVNQTAINITTTTLRGTPI